MQNVIKISDDLNVTKLHNVCEKPPSVSCESFHLITFSLASVIQIRES